MTFIIYTGALVFATTILGAAIAFLKGLQK